MGTIFVEHIILLLVGRQVVHAHSSVRLTASITSPSFLLIGVKYAAVTLIRDRRDIALGDGLIVSELDIGANSPLIPVSGQHR